MKLLNLYQNKSAGNFIPTSKSVRWLLAHDIRDPKRLQKVWRYLRKEGVRLQYSVYLLSGSRKQIQGVLDHLEKIIDKNVDDVRVYALGENTKIWGLGLQYFDGGNMLCDEVIDKLKVNDSNENDQNDENEGLSFS
jgi:CRISPR-associated protein Cas2